MINDIPALTRDSIKYRVCSLLDGAIGSEIWLFNALTSVITTMAVENRVLGISLIMIAVVNMMHGKYTSHLATLLAWAFVSSDE